MTSQRSDSRLFTFPRWANYVVPALLIAGAAGTPYLLLLVGLAGAPTTTDVGYQPHQPVPYSHELHVDQLGLDCRYCHTTVEGAAFAAIPSTNICMNCHATIHTASPNLEAMYSSFRDGLAIEWTKVHDLPDYAYFNHSAHVNKGVSCVECHGRVDHMGPEGVYQKEPLSMGWCLSCHRDPAPHLRPRDQVTNLLWGLKLTEDQIAQLQTLGVEGLQVGGALTDNQRRQIGQALIKTHQIKNPQQLSDCSACHR